MKWKNRLKKLALALFGLFIGALLTEAALRIIGYSYPYFYTTDYHRGYSPKPNQEGWFWVENKNYVTINSEGLRDREHSKIKPADTLRVAVLGDSFAEAKEVPMEQTFWSVMEQKLQACQAFAGKKVEVINFGVGGYGTAQELLTLRQKVWEYSPDIVLLTVTPYNDITDNYRPLKGADEVPYFNYQNGELVYDASFRDSNKYRKHDSNLFRFWIWLHNGSRLIQLIHHAQETARLKIATWKEQKRLSQSAESPEKAPENPAAPAKRVTAQDVGMHNLIYLEPAENNWHEAWRATEGLIVQMRGEVEQQGAKFLVAVVSIDVQAHPNKEFRQAFMKRLGVEHLFYPNRRLEAFAQRENITFLDLAQPMQSYAEQNNVYLHGFGENYGGAHWNPAGHSLAGHLITQKLCETFPN
jgi:hypothetical protein